MILQFDPGRDLDKLFSVGRFAIYFCIPVVLVVAIGDQDL